MRVRNDATFRAFRKKPRFHVVVSDGSIILAENLGTALDRADMMTFFGHHSVIRELPKPKKAER